MRGAILWSILVAQVAPQPKVVVLTPPGESTRPGRLESIRIQLSDLAVVTEAQTLPSGSLADRVAQAVTLVEATGAALAIWIEASTTADELVLYAVRQHRERALIQVIRLPAGSEAEIDRVVALKVGELVDAATSSPTPLQPAAPSPRTGDAGAQTPRPRSFGPLFEAGVAAALDSRAANSQLGAMVLAGGWRRFGLLTGEAYVVWRDLGDLEASAPAGRVVLDETNGGIGLRVRRQGRRVGAGLYVEVGARFIDALGIAAYGATGTAFEVVPTGAAGAEGRVMLSSWLALRGALGLELTPAPHRFALDGAPVIELGRGRGIGQLTLVISMP